MRSLPMIPDTARLLRPGGLLVFMTSGVLLMLCSGDEEAVDNRLVRDQFGMLRFESPALGEKVEFHLAPGEMIQLLRSSAFEAEALIEVQAPEGGSSGQWGFVTLEWARR